MDPSITSPRYSMLGLGVYERVHPTTHIRVRLCTDVTTEKLAPLAWLTMYGSVTWVFSSLSVITERTPKTTKAVAPSDEDMI